MFLIVEDLVHLSRLYQLGITFVIIVEVIYLCRIGSRHLLTEIDGQEILLLSMKMCVFRCNGISMLR